MTESHPENFLEDDSTLGIEVINFPKKQHPPSLDHVALDDDSLVALDRGQAQFVAVPSNISESSLAIDGPLITRAGGRISHMNDDIDHTNTVSYDNIDYVTLANDHHEKFPENFVPVNNVDFVEVGDNTLKGANGGPLELYFDVMTSSTNSQSSYMPRHEHQNPKTQLLVRAYTDFIQTQDHVSQQLPQDLNVHMCSDNNEGILPHDLDDNLLHIDQTSITDCKKPLKMDPHKRHIHMQLQQQKQDHDFNPIIFQHNYPHGQEELDSPNDLVHSSSQISNIDHIDDEKIIQAPPSQHINEEVVFQSSLPHQRYSSYHKPFNLPSQRQSSSTSQYIIKDGIISENLIQYTSNHQNRHKQSTSSDIYISNSIDKSPSLPIIISSEALKADDSDSVPLVSRSGRPIRRKNKYLEYVSKIEVKDEHTDSAKSLVDLKHRILPFEEEENLIDEPLEQLSNDDDDDADQNAAYTSDGRKSLPHKKRIPKKLKTTKRTLKCYKCNQCNEEFNSIDSFNKHYHSEIINKPTVYNCEICTNTFDSQLKFFEHLKSHYEPSKKHKCEVCNGEFASENALQEHSLVHKKEHFQCTVCHKTFRKESMLEVHIRVTHLDEENSTCIDKPYTCSICPNKYASQLSLDSHVTTDHADVLPEYNCEHCYRTFETRSKLASHQRIEHRVGVPNKKKTLNETKRSKTHSGKKNVYNCTYCTRTFQHKNSLVYHIKGHTGERPYQCDQCGKAFFASSALKVHLRMHSGEKPYECVQCGKHFRQYGDLRYHSTSVHSDVRQFQCEICGKDFKRKYCLVVHRRIHTGERNYKCEYCDRRFRASSYLQNHIKIHTGERPFPCPECGKRFRVRSDMKRHWHIHRRDASNNQNPAPNTSHSANTNIAPPGNTNSSNSYSNINTSNSIINLTISADADTSPMLNSTTVPLSANLVSSSSSSSRSLLNTTSRGDFGTSFGSCLAPSSSAISIGDPHSHVVISRSHSQLHLTAIPATASEFVANSPASSSSLPSEGELFLDETSNSCSSQPINLNILPRMMNQSAVSHHPSAPTADINAQEFQIISGGKSDVGEKDDEDVCVWGGVNVFSS